MHDLIQVIKILEPNEIKELNNFIDNFEFSKSSVMLKSQGNDFDNTYRSSTGCFLDENHEITMNFHSKINQGLDEYKKRLVNIHEIFSYYPMIGGYDTHSWRESIQVLEYEKNQEYKFHHDVANHKERYEFHRTISVIVYLTNDFEGGGTLFPHMRYKPEPGHALIFPSNWCYPHAGELVTEGIKRVAVTWYYVELN